MPRKLDSSDSDFSPDDFLTTVSFLRKNERFIDHSKIILAAEHTSFSLFFSPRDTSELVRGSTTLPWNEAWKTEQQEKKLLLLY